MLISDFVKLSLLEIRKGAKAASDKETQFYLDSDAGGGVHFDIAVTTSEQKKRGRKGSGKIGATLTIFSVNLGGEAEKSDEASLQQVHRIQFNVRSRDLPTPAKETKSK